MAIRVHELEIEKDYADSVYFGDKNFEVRNNDRGFQKGDEIIFHVLEKTSLYGTWYDESHPLHNARYEITYVLCSFCGLAQGYVAFGIKPMPEQTEKEGE